MTTHVPKVYEGESHRKVNAAGKEEKAATLEEAFEEAWEKAKADGAPSGTRFRVLEITFVGSNPIDQYKVGAKKDT